MIGKLRGLVDLIAKDHLIIDVGGVGYIVYCSGRTLAQLPQIGEAVSLQIDTHVREDNISLYGFISSEEKLWFRDLITVKGLGSKLALGILSILTPAMVNTAINIGDKNAFKQISGVGPKLAERIFTELKDKANKDISSNIQAMSVGNKKSEELAQDASSALQNLGYNAIEIHRIINKIMHENPEITLSELIKFSLKALAK